MKKFFCFIFIFLFIICAKSNLFAQNVMLQTINIAQIIETLDKNLLERLENILKQEKYKADKTQQNPSFKNLAQAKEIYPEQRIDLADICPPYNNYLEPKFFKLALDKNKNYVLIDLKTDQEAQTKQVTFSWKNLEGQYGYNFTFEVMLTEQKPYLLIKVEPFIKVGKDCPYTFISFTNQTQNITFTAMVYGKESYGGFIKNILREK